MKDHLKIESVYRIESSLRLCGDTPIEPEKYWHIREIETGDILADCDTIEGAQHLLNLLNGVSK